MAVLVILHVIWAPERIFVATMLTVSAAGSNVARLVLAGFPEFAAFASMQLAAVSNQLALGNVSVITVAVLTVVNVTVPAETAVLAATVVTFEKLSVVLVAAKAKGPPTPEAPEPNVVFVTVINAGKASR